MKDGFGETGTARKSKLEDRTTALCAANSRRSVKTLLKEKKPALRISAIGAAGETVEHGFSPGAAGCRRRLQHIDRTVGRA